MTVRVKGTPDRRVNETDTFGGGGSGGSTTVDNFPTDYPDSNADTRLQQILAQLDAPTTTRASEATLAALAMFLSTVLDVDLSTIAKEQTLLPVRNRFAPTVIGGYTSNPVNASGDTVIHTPALGKRIRLKWGGLTSPDTNSQSTIAKWRFGSGDYFWHWVMGKPGAFAHGAVREGDVDEPLILNLSVAQQVYVAFDLEEVA